MRHSGWDIVLVALSVAHAVVVFAAPSIPVIAVGLWWNSNTVSHNFVHLPFFRSSVLNRIYSIYLSLLTGVPQSLWRERHLAHHAGASPNAGIAERQAVHDRRQPRGFRIVGGGHKPAWQLFEIAAVSGLWMLIVSIDRYFFFSVYLPGYVTGLALCYIHGHFEHARGTVSHHGWFYNISFFNDGYHVEHHLRPAAHWTRLPGHARPDTPASRWPAVLRWLEVVNLELLERIVLRSAVLQRFLLRTHERAFRRLLPQIQEPQTVKIIGGGMFPRTAIVLRRLLPEAQITILDRDAENLKTARAFLDDRVALVHAVYEPSDNDDADLVVVPLAFIGDRRATYRKRRSGVTMVHDWIWVRHTEGARVSLFLLKRLNLVRS